MSAIRKQVLFLTCNFGRGEANLVTTYPTTHLLFPGPRLRP